MLKLRIFICISLGVMILLRLVWIQLRSYPVAIDLRSLAAIESLETYLGDSCRLALPWQLGPEIPAAPKQASWSTTPARLVAGGLGCTKSGFDEAKLVQWNQQMVALCVFLAALMVRMLTRSWTLTLIVAAMLLSRGRFIAAIGNLSGDLTVSALMMLWATLLVHFIKTGYFIGMVGMFLCTCLLALYDPIFLLIFLLIPVLKFALDTFLAKGARLSWVCGARGQLETRPYYRRHISSELLNIEWIRRLRRVIGFDLSPEEPDRDPMEPHKPGGLRPLWQPFLIWAQEGISVKTLLAISGICLAIVTGIYLKYSRDSITSWILLKDQAQLVEWAVIWASSWTRMIDLDLVVVFVLCIISLFQSPGDGVPGFWEVCFLSVVTFLSLSVAASFQDLMEFSRVSQFRLESFATYIHHWGRSTPIFLWFEPVMLSLGCVALVNLIKTIDAKVISH